METYKFDGYTLTLEQTSRIDNYGHVMVRYTFRTPKGTLLFNGDDFGASPLHDPVGIESAKDLLSFLTVRKGDTDEDYFDNYTDEQIEFSESWDCEQLQLYTLDEQS